MTDETQITDAYVYEQLDALQRASSSPSEELALWRAPTAPTNEPFWLVAARFAQLRQYNLQAVLDGYTSEGVKVAKFLDKCNAKLGAPQIVPIKETRILLFLWYGYGDQRSVHPRKLAFERSPAYGDPPGYAPDYWRQCSKGEVDHLMEAIRLPEPPPRDAPPKLTFDERLQVHCAQHDGPIADCGCKAFSEIVGFELPEINATGQFTPANVAQDCSDGECDHAECPEMPGPTPATGTEGAAGEAGPHQGEPAGSKGSPADSDSSGGGSEIIPVYPLDQVTKDTLLRPFTFRCDGPGGCGYREENYGRRMIEQARTFGCPNCQKISTVIVEDQDELQAWPAANANDVARACSSAVEGLPTLKVAELRKLFRDVGGSGGSKLKKADLVKALRENCRADLAEEGAK